MGYFPIYMVFTRILKQNARFLLKLAKYQAKAKQQLEAELLIKMSQKTIVSVLMRLYD